MASELRLARPFEGLAILGVVVGLGLVGTSAAWTGTTEPSVGTPSATVHLGLAGADHATARYALPLRSGQWVSGSSQATALVLVNSGPRALRYTLSGIVEDLGVGALGAALDVRITTGQVTGASPTVTCSGQTVLHKPPGRAFPSVEQPVLEPGSTLTLCVQYGLPATAPAVKGTSSKVTVTFTSKAVS